MVGDALQLHGGETSSEPVVLRSAVWKTEHLVLARPPGRDIAETGNSNPARQATFDGHFDQIGCQKGERDRHVDIADVHFSRAAICSTSVTVPATFHRARADHGRLTRTVACRG
jgi:hypothetical protein